MRRSLLAGLAAVSLGGCLPAERPDPETVRRAILANNAAAERYYAAGQADSLATLMAADVWQLPPHAPPVVGRDSARAYWATALTWGRWDFDFRTADVVTADSIAVERGSFTLRFTAGPRSPIPSMEDRGNYVVLWRRESDGQWRGVWDAPVSSLPPPGAPPAGATPPAPGAPPPR